MGKHVRALAVAGAAAVSALVITQALASAASGFSYSISPVTTVTTRCSGQNAEVEQAVDPGNPAIGKPSYVYADWMGCQGIGFARSTDGGRHFDAPQSLPGSVGSSVNAWDPAVTVGPNGTVYAAFMRAKDSDWYPVVAASFDHGLTFPQVSFLKPPVHKNWGDRDFIAVGPDGWVYVTWDYGPERTSVTFITTAGGSSAFATGDLNAVVQRSPDGGKTWGPIIPISPGFPASGADSAPLVVEPSGRIDVLYQGYQITNTTTFTMNPAFSYFTSSMDHGRTWSAPVKVGAQGGTMSLAEWWIDGNIARDSAGNLYATWDTQGTNPDGTSNDIGWLSFSTDHGQSWSTPSQASADVLNVPHITEVAAGGPGIAYVGWLSDSAPQGYAQYIRPYSIAKGWLSDPIRVSRQYGDAAVWPGDTFGISTLSPNSLALTWGSAVPLPNQPPPNRLPKSDIYAAQVTFQIP